MNIIVQPIESDPALIRYHFYDSRVGKAIIASANDGICFLGFSEDEARLFDELRSLFPASTLLKQSDDRQLLAARLLFDHECSSQTLHVRLKGTPFQLKVWHHLLSVSAHRYISYGQLAAMVGLPKAAQAVGSAVGRNPVSYFIPCHRILAKQGIGGYRWGVDCKRAIIDWENMVCGRE